MSNVPLPSSAERINLPSPPPPTSRPSTLNVHVAEYSVLSNRLTYWISLQYVLYGILGTALAFLVNAAFEKDAPPESLQLISWLSLLVPLLLGWAILQTVDEILSTAIYIEEVLRPAVLDLLTTETSGAQVAVWRWEVFLRIERGGGWVGRERKAGLMPVFVLGVIFAVDLLRKHSDLLWSYPTILAFGAAVWVTFMCWIKLRHINRLHARLDAATDRRLKTGS